MENGLNFLNALNLDFSCRFGSFGTTSAAKSQCVAAVAALTISILRDRSRGKRLDKRWVRLASGLLEVPNSLLHKYITCILLADAIFIVRQTVQTYSGSKERHRNDILDVSSKTLGTVYKLKIGDTLPELQHELWNKLILTVKTDKYSHHVVPAKMTLKNIRELYIALHRSTIAAAEFTTTDDLDSVQDNPESYSMCTLDAHRSALAIPESVRLTIW